MNTEAPDARRQPPSEGISNKLRRRIEDALRKVATHEDLIAIARILKVKI